MKKQNEFRSIVIRCFALLLPFMVLQGAQASPDKKYLSRIETTISEDGTRADLSMQIALPANIVSADQSVEVVPSVVSSDGKVRHELPHVLFNGKLRAPYYRRARNLQSHEAYIRETPYAVRVLGKDTEPVDYRAQAPYQKGDKIVVRYLAKDCCDTHVLGEEVVLLEEPVAEPPAPEAIIVTQKNLTSFLMPKPEEKKYRDEQVEVRVQYKWDDDRIYPNYADNQAELDRLNQLLKPLLTQTGLYTIDSGSITGYASPEGNAQYNQSLSERRAKSVRDHIQTLYPNANIRTFAIRGEGDDWAGLTKALETSSISNRKELQEIISQESNVTARKEKLSKNPSYSAMYADLYPPLRRTVIDVHYLAKGVKREEAKELFFTRPKDLSVYEAYDLLEELGKEHAQIDLHKVIADSHPTSVEAQVNYSTLLLLAGRLDEAYRVLQRVGSDSRAYNNLAVYYILKEDYSTAREYLQLAVPSPEKNLNLKSIEGR